MGYYDVHQICLNGHQITFFYKSNPESRKKFCNECGEKTIHQCPSCKHPIKGDYYSEDIVGSCEIPLPSHCENCGEPYPWSIPKDVDTKERIFSSGTQHDAYVEIKKIFQLAKTSLFIIDTYIDGTIFEIISTIPAPNLKIQILTYKLQSDFTHEAVKFLAQYKKFQLDVRKSKEVHDRFIIIDQSKCFHIGASIKDAGGKLFMIKEIMDSTTLLNQINSIWDSANCVELASNTSKKKATNEERHTLEVVKTQISRSIEDYGLSYKKIVEQFPGEVNRINNDFNVRGAFYSGMRIKALQTAAKEHKDSINEAKRKLERDVEDILLTNLKQKDINKIPALKDESKKINELFVHYEKCKNDFETTAKQAERSINKKI